MLYIDGCPICGYYKKIIQKNKVENVIKPINFKSKDLVSIDEKVLNNKKTMSLTFPAFYTKDKFGNVKLLSGLLLRESVSRTLGDLILT